MKARALTLAELRKCQAAVDSYAADVLSVAYGYDKTEDEARAWLDSITAGEALRLIRAVSEASLLTEDAQFPDAAADDVRLERAAQ